jgi:hypothetical protein
MIATLHAAVTLMFVVVVVPPAFAAKTYYVCWGQKESGQPPTCQGRRYDTHFACGSGGHTGYNKEYVCQTLCKKADGQGCVSQPTFSIEGHECGYDWVTVTCED